jgi:hypothetical protein
MAEKLNELGGPQVFNIRMVKCSVNGKTMSGIAAEGFGITPAGDSSVIDGLVSEVGFNVDTTTRAEASLSLNASSPDNAYLRGLIMGMQDGSQTPVEFKIEVIDPKYINSFGFANRGMRFAWIQGFPEYKTDKKNAPTYTYKFLGYSYFENTA